MLIYGTKFLCEKTAKKLFFEKLKMTPIFYFQKLNFQSLPTLNSMSIKKNQNEKQENALLN